MARTERGKHGHWLSIRSSASLVFNRCWQTPVRAGEREVCVDQLLQSWNAEKFVIAPSGNWISGKAVTKFLSDCELGSVVGFIKCLSVFNVYVTWKHPHAHT